MKSAYLNRILENVEKNYPYEKEFIQAVKEFLGSMDCVVENDPDIERLAILERLVEPDRLITFRVPWVNDKGEVIVNRGYRVQFNNAIGPYKGGLRFHESVNSSIIKFLGFEQIFKNSLTGLPMGGGKGGSDFTSRGKSDGEIMRFCQSFMSELYRHIGDDVDVPAGDIGVGAREIGYLFGYYKKLANRYTGVITGKAVGYGGSLVRKEATGYGVCYFTEELLKVMKNDSLKGKKVVVSGSGNVGTYCAMKAQELGAKVVAMSDISGVIYDENGLDVALVEKIKGEYKVLKEYLNTYPNISFNEDVKSLWRVKCDIAFPCATQNEIDLDDAKALVENNIIALVEGANMPTSIEATNYLMENGVIFAPGKAANAGGVATSCLEMAQNASHIVWKAEEVDSKLKDIMVNIFNNIYNTSCKYNQKGNLVLGANIAGFLRVYEAMKAQGVL